MEQRARLENGLSLSYVRRGDPGGVPVLMLHGVTDSWHSYSPVLEDLPRSLCAYALSQRGHGDSDRPAAGYRTRDFAADAVQFLDAMGIERAIVVGHSMGTTNALRLAIDHPHRVLGVVLIGAFASYRRNAAALAFAEEVAKLADPIAPAFAREFQLSTLAMGVRTAFLETVIGESLKVPARVWRQAFDGMLEDDFVDELRTVHAPVEMIWGAKDGFCTREDQDALLEVLPRARLTVYDQSGHAPHWEEPARVAAQLAHVAREWALETV
jgi:pimeloyl-ACP methyl ester carboxylesterase